MSALCTSNRGTAPAGVIGRSGKETKYGAMGNALFDMDIGSPYIFPYLGAGAGYQSVTQRLSQTDTGGVSEHISGDKGAFAYQAMFGATHAFLPEHNGVRPNTLHVLLHACTAATLVVLARLTH